MKQKYIFWIVMAAIIFGSGSFTGIVINNRITINTPPGRSVYVPYGTYAATIDASTILVATGNFSLFLNLDPQQTYTVENQTIVYRPSSKEGETYYEAWSENSGFELKIFSSDIERGQYAYQQYVCSKHVTSTRFFGFDDKAEKPETNFSCDTRTQTLNLSPQNVYIFWGNASIDYPKSGSNASDNMLVVNTSSSTYVKAVWEQGQGSYTITTLHNYQTVACQVAAKENYQPDQITSIGLNQFNC